MVSNIGSCTSNDMEIIGRPTSFDLKCHKSKNIQVKFFHSLILMAVDLVTNIFIMSTTEFLFNPSWLLLFYEVKSTTLHASTSVCFDQQIRTTTPMPLRTSFTGSFLAKSWGITTWPFLGRTWCCHYQWPNYKDVLFLPK